MVDWPGPAATVALHAPGIQALAGEVFPGCADIGAEGG
jgi:hypothetical protein